MLLSVPLLLTLLASDPEAPPPPAVPTPELAAPASATTSSARLLPAGTEVPFSGGVVPPGARVKKVRADALYYTGAGLVLGTMVISAIACPIITFVTQGDSLARGMALYLSPVFFLVGAVPILGPLYGRSQSAQFGEPFYPVVGNGWQAMFSVFVVAQLVGGVLAVAGLFSEHRVLHYDEAGPAPKDTPGVVLLPVGPAGSTGATFAMVF